MQINGIWQENEDDWFKWYECKTCGYILGLVCDYPTYKLPTKCPECERDRQAEEDNIDEATYEITLDDASSLIAFIRRHEPEEIPESIFDICRKLEDFIYEEL